MDSRVQFADLNRHNELLADITKLEREISDKTGQDIILIAYTPKK